MRVLVEIDQDQALDQGFGIVLFVEDKRQILRGGGGEKGENFGKKKKNNNHINKNVNQRVPFLPQ